MLIVYQRKQAEQIPFISYETWWKACRILLLKALKRTVKES